MTNQYLSDYITIGLGPTYGSDISRIRNGQLSWLDGLSTVESSDDPIVTLQIPLEAVDVMTNAEDTHPLSRPALEFVQAGPVEIQGVTPDPYVREALRAGGQISPGVDALFRSVVLADIDERTLLKVLQRRVDLDSDQYAALHRSLLIPAFYDERDNEIARQATRLLKEHIRQHEREHVRCLINPPTALWREIELYWRSVLAAINYKTWTDPGFLDRLAALYVTPSRFTAELLAMVTEDHRAENPVVQQAIANIASRRGTEEELIQIINQRDVDEDELVTVLRTSTGEQWCDLWLAYVIDAVRSGKPLTTIDSADFHDRLRRDESDGVTVESPQRRAMIDFMNKRRLEPVCEVVRLRLVEGQFVLELSWFSTNPDVSADGGLLAIRRALYRRQFLSSFGVESGLATVRTQLESAVEQVICDGSDCGSLFDVSLPALDASDLETARNTAATTLFDSQIPLEELEAWLNDATYGFNR